MIKRFFRDLVICLIIGIGIFIALRVSNASAHTNYAGHSVKYWTFTNPTSGAVTYYRERLIDQGGCSTHAHYYLTERREWVNVQYVWRDIHEHIRYYACHAV